MKRILARWSSKCWRGWSESVIFQIANLTWFKSFQSDQLVKRPVEAGNPNFCVNGKFCQSSLIQFRVYKSFEHVLLTTYNKLDIRTGVHCAFCATFSNPISGRTRLGKFRRQLTFNPQIWHMRRILVEWFRWLKTLSTFGRGLVSKFEMMTTPKFHSSS